MITEPATDGQRSHCRNLKPCYIGVATLPFAGLCRYHGRIKTMRDCEGSLTTTMARIVSVASWGGSNGTKHEVER